jgi:hypothetical protein
MADLNELSDLPFVFDLDLGGEVILSDGIVWFVLLDEVASSI